MKIRVDNIQVKEGRRELDGNHVRELADSIRELGLLNPVTVDKENVLIAGLHRLEAVKLLEWPEVECTVSSLEGLRAELAEIDENLVRHDLNYIDEGEQLARRKEIYETLHPETRQGMRNGQTSKTETVAVLETKPFAEDTAEKIGVAARTVRSKIQVVKNLTPEVKGLVKEKDIGFKNAVKLSRLEPEQQKEAAALLAAKEIKTVDEYTATKVAEPAPEPVEPKNDVSEPIQTEEAKQKPASVSTVPYSLPQERYATIKESVADLKDPDKDCSCTPDLFLAEYSAFISKFNREIKWYGDSQYEAACSELSLEQMKYLRQLTDDVCAAAESLYQKIERMQKK